MSVRTLFSLLFCISTLFIYYESQSQALPESNQIEIIFIVPDTLVSTGIDSGFINIYLDNFNYEIFGFQFVLKSNRPDLVLFDFSGLGYETSGTLVDGFEYIEVIDRAGDQSEYWFRCIADIFSVPGSHSGILPQQGGVAVRIPYTTTNAPDTTLSLLSELTIETPTDFSDPYGYSIGAVPDTVVDTTYYNCTLWVGNTCSTWVEVTDTSLGYDMVQYDSTVVGLLDPEIVLVHEGSITLNILNCDFDGTGFIDIADLICFVNYMFQPEEPYSCSLLYCDTDMSSSLDIADLVYLVSYMFNSGPPPPDL